MIVVKLDRPIEIGRRRIDEIELPSRLDGVIARADDKTILDAGALFDRVAEANEVPHAALLDRLSPGDQLAIVLGLAPQLLPQLKGKSR